MGASRDRVRKVHLIAEGLAVPTFSVQDGRHFVAYVTGPSHIRLGLLLTTAPVENPLIIERPQSDNARTAKSTAAELVGAVRVGIASVSAAIYAAEIIYVANDSPRTRSFRGVQLFAERFFEQPDESQEFLISNRPTPDLGGQADPLPDSRPRRGRIQALTVAARRRLPNG